MKVTTTSDNDRGWKETMTTFNRYKFNIYYGRHDATLALPSAREATDLEGNGAAVLCCADGLNLQPDQWSFWKERESP